MLSIDYLGSAAGFGSRTAEVRLHPRQQRNWRGDDQFARLSRPRSVTEVIVMRWKAMSIGIVFLAVLGTTSAMAQSSPPPSSQAQETEALVNKAAALIDAKGRAAAFSEFRTKGSEWFHGDTYLFAYDLKGNVLLNPAFPAREGTNVSGQKDANGKLFHDAIIRTAETKGSGWVDYMFPQTWADTAIAEVGLRQGREDRRRSRIGCFGLLSRVGIPARLRLGATGPIDNDSRKAAPRRCEWRVRVDQRGSSC